MCGIFSYAGKDPKGIRIILEGLRNLGHRGYDSIGIAFMSDGEEGVAKISTENKLQISTKDLEVMLGDIDKECFWCIGHTRWASCGEVSDRNAHPHSDNLKRCSVIHNGNIENFQELKNELQKYGVIFSSETDTEVIAHLFARCYRGDAVAAGKEVLSRLIGANAFVVMIKDRSPKIVAVNRGGTLIIGKGEKGIVITSDPMALPSWVFTRLDLESREIALLDGEDCIIFENGSRIEKQASSCEGDEVFVPDMISGSLMLREIYDQPEVIRNAMSGRLVGKNGSVKLGGLERVDGRLRSVRTFHLIGCGTAYMACQYAVLLLRCFGVPAYASIASEFFCPSAVISRENDKKAFLFLSQSGETADVISVLEKMKDEGNVLLGLVNVVGSKIARMTEAGIYTRAGIERGVASTKAFTAHLVSAVLMSVYLGQQRGMSQESGRNILSELRTLPEKIERILELSDSIRKLARKYRDMKNCYFLGRSFNYITAQEGALKLKEISYIHAESYPLGEMKHGPLALIDEDFCSFVIAPGDSVYKKSLANIREIKARRGKVIAVTDERVAEEIGKIADEIVIIPDTHEYLSPILTVIPFQLFAYHMAVELGFDPDKPRNLAKTVTVE